MLVVPMFWGKLKLRMLGELVATVIWFAVPWIEKVDVVRLLIVIAPEPVPVIVITFGEEVETVTVPAPMIEVVAFERPLMAVMPLPPVLETFAGVQKVPFHVRTWFVEGAVEEIALPWMPITVWDVELPERSPPAVKLPIPQPTQFPLTTRFWSVVVDPVIVTVPGNVAVMPDLPIVMAVEDEVPMVTMPEPSTMTPESPVMPAPLKVSAAEAIWMPAKTTRAIAAATPPP